MHISRRPAESQVRALLAACALPGDDLEAQHFEHFFGCGPEDALRGVVGVEILGAVGLLRSLAVAESARGRGCGKRLVEAVEAHAKSKGVRTLYLLTNDAASFFAGLGYQPVDRQSAPDEIRGTQQFGSACCCSATLMVKHLDG